MEDTDLDELAGDWRGALDAAEDTLDAVGRCRALHFPPPDLRDRCNLLAHERVETEKSLEELARTTNTHLPHLRRSPRRYFVGANLNATSST